MQNRHNYCIFISDLTTYQINLYQIMETGIKFSIGDKVKILRSPQGTDGFEHVGKTGVITQIDEDDNDGENLPYYIKIGKHTQFWFANGEFKAI